MKPTKGGFMSNYHTPLTEEERQKLMRQVGLKILAFIAFKAALLIALNRWARSMSK